MSVSIDVDEQLGSDDVVYRIVDYFTAVALISHGKFFFSRADTFIDKNEGVLLAIADLYQSIPVSLCGGVGWSTPSGAEARHNRFKRGHYMSCWTRNPESVALWSLYSQDQSGVRIAMKIGTLKRILEAFAAKFDFSTITDEDIGKSVPLAVYAKIVPVTYIDLSDMARRAEKRAKAASRLLAHRPDAFQFKPGRSYGSNARKTQIRNFFGALDDFPKYKDSSFEHEKEIRMILRIGENKITPKFLEDGDFIIDDPGRGKAFKPFLSSWLDKMNPSQYESVVVATPPIESVCIDPRCSQHKKDVMMTFFQSNKIKVVDSTSFGYVPKQFRVLPP